MEEEKEPIVSIQSTQIIPEGISVDIKTTNITDFTTLSYSLGLSKLGEVRYSESAQPSHHSVVLNYL